MQHLRYRVRGRRDERHQIRWLLATENDKPAGIIREADPAKHCARNSPWGGKRVYVGRRRSVSVRRSGLTGWIDPPGVAPRTLRHPSLRGPLLELCPEPALKGAAKNRLHLDIRLENGDDPDGVAAGIAERGGRELHPEWGELPWRVHADPSGNELCVLPAGS